ncbi:unnamed protein product [Spodoptera littoralis]|uniref:Catalase core domain-containing protein n=1 Tax=Spodoptera littoralis TaxID=7109 RepID=A0A9P0HY17_SPOLI|nr:unnamed protein product [Spodoptera littoralis]CAH1636599.1 unnamed protein product [Spodoptera littoralis]
MKQLVVSVVVCAVVQYVIAIRYHNETRPSPVNRQLSEFLHEHPKPIGVYTRLTGDPLDIRDTVTLNTNIFDNKNLFMETSHLVRERIPERIVHAKGYGAFGYFEVTHDVSQYTKADVFNGIGKKTPLVGRFSTAIENLGGNAQAAALNLESPDYFNIDLYNAIAEKNYPSWRLEMDILTKEDLEKVDYDPFDLTRLWKRDAQNYRLGGNHHNIQVNAPLYDKTYNRDGVPPVRDNMKYTPNYYPNSFHGPMPYVDEARPTEMLKILHSNAIDLQPLNEFYNEIVDTDAHRQRIADYLAESLVNVPTGLQKRAIYILTLIDIGLGRRVKNALQISKNIDRVARRNQIAECIANVDEASKRPRHKIQKTQSYYYGRN